MFIYQPTFSTLYLKDDKGTKNALDWKSKVLFQSKFKPLNLT